MFQTNVEKIKTRVLCCFFIENNVEKYCRGGQTTDDKVIRRKRIARWIPRLTICNTYEGQSQSSRNCVIAV